MCERGTTQEVIIDGKSISIDSCIAGVVKTLNETGLFHTLGSCCGHGLYRPTIVMRDGLSPSTVTEYYSRLVIPRKRNFYRKDADGMYFLPEVEANG